MAVVVVLGLLMLAVAMGARLRRKRCGFVVLFIVLASERIE